MMLATTLIFAALTGFMAFLCAGKNNSRMKELSEDLDDSKKLVKSLEKKQRKPFAKSCSKPQQHQDINQLKAENQRFLCRRTAPGSA